MDYSFIPTINAPFVNLGCLYPETLRHMPKGTPSIKNASHAHRLSLTLRVGAELKQGHGPHCGGLDIRQQPRASGSRFQKTRLRQRGDGDRTLLLTATGDLGRSGRNIGITENPRVSMTIKSPQPMR